MIPVVRAAHNDEARQAMQAIYTGGITIVEITMTILNCPTVIRDVVREYGNKILVGVGTNVAEYFAAGNFAVGIGSELAASKPCASKPSEIYLRAKALLQSVGAALQLQRKSANS
jgi:2-keto-3-deoxy-6-phosphogluconate aldolase